MSEYIGSISFIFVSKLFFHQLETYDLEDHGQMLSPELQVYKYPKMELCWTHFVSSIDHSCLGFKNGDIEVQSQTGIKS